MKIVRNVQQGIFVLILNKQQISIFGKAESVFDVEQVMNNISISIINVASISFTMILVGKIKKNFFVAKESTGFSNNRFGLTE